MKKTYKVIVICVLAFVFFVSIVIIAFNSIANDSIDKIAISYIRQNAELKNKYGELIWIGRNILYESQNDESMIKSAYTVEISSGRVIVYVTLIENDGDWEAISLEEVEVILNEKQT